MNKYAQFSKAPRRIAIPRCSEKLSFGNPAQAARLMQKYGHRCYECSLCHRYHLTSRSDD